MLNIVKELSLVLMIDQNLDVFGNEVKALPPLRPEYQHALVAEIGDYVWLVNNTPANTTLTVVSDYLEKLIVDMLEINAHKVLVLETHKKSDYKALLHDYQRFYAHHEQFVKFSILARYVHK